MMTFEGIEKRIEVVFEENKGESLRERIKKQKWEEILKQVGCMIMGEMSEEGVDSYVLSTSTLFVFDHRIVIKTCGETQIFKAIHGIVGHLSQSPIGLKFTRGGYFWPEKQPSDHKSFKAERSLLSRYACLDNNKEEKEKEFGMDKIHKFHFYGAAASSSVWDAITVEIMMTELDEDKASVFFSKSKSKSKTKRETMTSASKIDKIFPDAKISDHEFEPCGYSLNGVIGGGGTSVFNVHVTPERDFSFASFEVYGSVLEDNNESVKQVVEKVIACFLPGKWSVLVHFPKNKLQELVLEGTTKETQSFGDWGTLVHYSYYKVQV